LLPELPTGNREEEDTLHCDALVLCLGALQQRDIELQRRIERQLQRPEPPALILLGSASQEEIQRFTDKGAVQCLYKPVKISTLKSALKAVFSREPGILEHPVPPAVPVSPPASAAASRQLDGQRILVADDNPINRQLVAILLRKMGAEVTLATDGEEALTLARARHFDLIMLDIHMPGMDGFEAAAALQQLPGRGKIPIVAMTADAMWRNRQRILRKGFQAYLIKPIEERELLLILRDTLFGSAGKQDTPELSSTSGAALAEERPSSLPIRDEVQALRIAGGSKSIAENLFAQFLNTLADDVHAMGKLVEAEQWEDLWQSIHHLQGAVAVCGVPAFSAALKQLQASVRNENRKTAQAAFQNVIVEQRRLQQLTTPLPADTLRHRA
ncbi:MAG TPA: response regulator, partial [Chromatiaceae bacterium]|nr:response regulator [Chromatiaceae bacterium]